MCLKWVHSFIYDLGCINPGNFIFEFSAYLVVIFKKQGSILTGMRMDVLPDISIL